MLKQCLAVGAMAAVLLGCQTNRGTHYVPVSRDYQEVTKHDEEMAADALRKAHRVGAQHYAPYDYFSAVQYLNMAYDSKAEGDRKGTWDYAKLSQDYAEAAIRDGSGITDRGEPTMPDSYDTCLAEYNRLKGRYEELDQAKAIEVSPVIYAHLTSELSRAEHELNEPRQWERAARRMVTLESDIDTIWSQDVDGDGVVDMKDGAPWAPEDKDGFQDEDGVPDPDNDKDGILDLDDVKPNDPETANRWHDFDGAPDSYPTLETIYFASGSAAYSAETKGYLRGITELLKEWPELKLHIKGHTDNTHGETYNVDLSQRRAEAIHKYMVTHGAPDGQLVVTFHGESEPAADNYTAAGKAQNRRVELILE